MPVLFDYQYINKNTQCWVMFSARCAEMGESGFAPTRRMTNRFLVYMWEMYKTHFLDPVVVGALPTTPEIFNMHFTYSLCAVRGRPREDRPKPKTARKREFCENS